MGEGGATTAAHWDMDSNLLDFSPFFFFFFFFFFCKKVCSILRSEAILVV